MRNVIAEVLRSHFVKHVVVVDDDIDARDMTQVEWAIATRVQPDRDLIIIPGDAGLKIDPSQLDFPTGVGAKMGIDATRPLHKDYPPMVGFPEDMMKQIEAKWKSYGF